MIETFGAASSLSSRIFGVSWKILLLLFVFMHFYDLKSRPLHHDEGVNGNFMRKMIAEKRYKYDPENYHGPSLYYIQLIPTWIHGLVKDGPRNFKLTSTSGLTPVSIRSVVAFAGVLMLMGILWCYPALGRWGALGAFVLAGFSADLLYFSRYFIHETFVLLFTLGIYMGAVHFDRMKKKPYFYLSVLSAALLFCTKETSVVIFGILFLSYVLTDTTCWLLQGRKSLPPHRSFATKISTLYYELQGHIPLAISLGVVIWILLFTSFFSNSGGPLDSFRTYNYWTREGVESGHVKPFPYYISEILIRYELPIFLLCYVGIIAALLRNDKKGIFLSYWTLGTIGFYSLVPYKTPWLVVNLVLPMALTAGYGIQALVDLVRQSRLPIGKKAAFTVIFLLVAAPFAFQLPRALKVVYKEYDHDRHPQAYAHTTRSIYGLLDQIHKVVGRPGGDKYLNINVFTEKYWPLPFYLMDFPYVHYYGTPEGVKKVDADIIIADTSKRDMLSNLLKDVYVTKHYSLRPGVPYTLYINQNVTGAGSASVKVPDLLHSQNLSIVQPGLRKAVHDGTDFHGAPISQSSSDTSFDFWWVEPDQKQYTSPFSIRWDGTIRIKTAGTYKFSLESDDGSWLWIDDKLIVDNGGEHSNIRASGRANLSAGYHKVEIKYFDVGGGAILRFFWTPPNGKESVIPKDIFFH